VTEYPVRSKFLVGGQVALGAIVAFVAIGLVAVPSGGAAVAGVIAAVVVVLGGGYLIRAMRRQAIIVDGERLGWRRGLSSKISGWTDLAAVEAATVAKLSTSITRKRPDVILWTRTGGLQGANAVLLRPQLPADLRRQLDARAASSEPLNPFIVPFSALPEQGRTAISDLLAARGLLPG
jgi:hypothetical protein